ncbi:MAG TPA: hypothetical protein VL486_07825 [Verrucomicrobiae bacterium]|nr:hypothetical protein [Verrucomicrobiae bacterium]
MKSISRFQQFPEEANRIGQILFWLFPYEQETFRRRPTRPHRTSRGATNVRVYQDVRQASRVGVQ